NPIRSKRLRDALKEASGTDELSQSGTSMSPKKDTQKSAKNTTSINKKFKVFTAEERVAMRERIQELKASARRGPRPDNADGESNRAREDRPDAGTGSRHGQAASCDHQSQRASPLAETLVRDARLCQGRQRRLLLPKRAEVQDEVRDVRLQRQGEPRRRRHVADRLRSEGVNHRRGGKDRRAREESGELRTELATGPHAGAGLHAGWTAVRGR